MKNRRPASASAGSAIVFAVNTVADRDRAAAGRRSSAGGPPADGADARGRRRSGALAWRRCRWSANPLDGVLAAPCCSASPDDVRGRRVSARRRAGAAGRRPRRSSGLIGRYMALSALSWSVGFAVGPALGGLPARGDAERRLVLAGGLCLLAGSCRWRWSGRYRGNEGALPSTSRRPAHGGRARRRVRIAR